MSLTRKYLKELGIDSEKIDLIIDAHTDTTDALKMKIDDIENDLKEAEGKAKRVTELENEIETLKNNATDDSEWKTKFETEHAEFEAFKNSITEKEALQGKTEAYTALLKESGIGDKYIQLILDGTDLNTIEVEDNKIKDAETLTASLKSKYKDFIETVEAGGTDTPNPPAGKGDVDLANLSMEEYIKARSK